MSKKKEKAILSWSGGKDSSLALHAVSLAGNYEISALLTTVTEGYQRISMHGIRRSLLHQQAKSLGIPLIEVDIPQKSDMQTYEDRMESALRAQIELGISTVIFGDIFLEDLRDYRVENLKLLDLNARFPLWKKDTRQLADSFIQQGFKASVAVVDTNVLDASFAGRPFTTEFLNDLPANIDPCGENGEFHTFAYDGPIFDFPIEHSMGEVVLRDKRFNFADFIPAHNANKES